MVGAIGFALRSSFGNAARSWTLASVTTAAISTPAESTRTWRLTSSTFFAPSKPRGAATGEALTDEESTMAAVGRRRRPDRVRTSPRTAVRIRAQTPGAAPAQEMLVRRRPRHGEVVRQMPPGASGAQHVQDGLEVLPPPLRWARPPTAWMFRHEVAGDASPRGVRQVGAVPASTGSWGT